MLVVLTGPVGGVVPDRRASRGTRSSSVPIFVAARPARRPVGLLERLYLLPAIGVQAVFLLTFLNNVWVG